MFSVQCTQCSVYSACHMTLVLRAPPPQLQTVCMKQHPTTQPTHPRALHVPLELPGQRAICLSSSLLSQQSRVDSRHAQQPSTRHGHKAAGWQAGDAVDQLEGVACMQAAQGEDRCYMCVCVRAGLAARETGIPEKSHKRHGHRVHTCLVQVLNGPFEGILRLLQHMCVCVAVAGVWVGAIWEGQGKQCVLTQSPELTSLSSQASRIVRSCCCFPAVLLSGAANGLFASAATAYSLVLALRLVGVCSRTGWWRDRTQVCEPWLWALLCSNIEAAAGTDTYG